MPLQILFSAIMRGNATVKLIKQTFRPAVSRQPLKQESRCPLSPVCHRLLLLLTRFNLLLMNLLRMLRHRRVSDPLTLQLMVVRFPLPEGLLQAHTSLLVHLRRPHKVILVLISLV